VFTADMVTYEEGVSLELCLRTTDNSGLYYEKSFSVPVLGVSFAPTDISFAFRELHDQDTAGMFVGKLTTADLNAEDVHVYTLESCSGGDGNAAFVVRHDSVFTSGIVFYDQAPVLGVCIRSTDLDGLYFEESFQLPVIDSHDPTDIILPTLSVEEGNPEDYFMSKIQVVDGDLNDSFTYTLVPGDGDEDNAQFYIEDDALYLAYVTYYDVKKSYSIRIRASDAKGAFYEEVFTVTVIDHAGVSKGLPSVNYISPNGDGINDYWVVKNVEIYQDFSVSIFDPFGNVIFQKDGQYNNEWDGTRNGRALPDGNYYYVFKNGERIYRGNITIVNK
jgi:gliding motility-associated-like protein